PPRRNPRLTGCPREPNLMPQRRRPGPPSNCRCAAERRSGPVRDYRDCRFDGVTPETEETPVTDVTTSQDQEQLGLSAADEQVLRELTERARAGGLRLTGEGGLLGKLTKLVVEGALDGELDGHLGYGKHDPAGRDGGNSRNGHRVKTVITEAGPGGLSGARGPGFQFVAGNRSKTHAGGYGGWEGGDFTVGEGADAWGDLRAPGRGLRRGGVQADDHRDHRPGDGGPGGLAEPAIGLGLRGRFHRCDQREDP